MAVPYFPTYVLFAGLHLRSRALEAYDWSDLLKDAPKRGVNRVIPGQHGTEVRPRTRGEVRAALLVRVSGEWTTSNVPVVGEDAQVAQFYTNLALLRARTERVTLQTIQLVTPHATYSAPMIIEDGGTPKFLNTRVAELAIDLTLPSGALPLEGV